VACAALRGQGREAYLKEWFQKNRDTKVREYRQKNAAKIKEGRKSWEQKTNYSKLWRLANKDKVLEYRERGLEALKADPERLQARKAKQSASHRVYYSEHSETIKERAKKYYEENRDQVARTNKAWSAANRDKVNEIKRRYAKANPDKVLANVRKRQLLERKAIPNWIDEAALKRIRRLYEAARAKTLSTGVPHEVDHIFPLKGDNVCGLHVPSNLRVVSRLENRSKGKKVKEDW